MVPNICSIVKRRGSSHCYGSGVRVVLLGKGGSGKSTLAGLLATTLHAGGERVLALDADSVPGLGQVLGVEPSDDYFLAGQAVRENGGWHLVGGTHQVVDHGARVAPGGVRFLQSGHADASMKDFEGSRRDHPGRWSGLVAFHTVARSHDDEGGWVVVDLQGGTLQVASGMAGQAGVAMVVVEPFAKSVLTARRFAEMGEWPAGLRLVAVANKVATADDERFLEAELAALGVPLWAAIPADPAIAEAERAGRPLVSLPPGTPARQAVEALVARLRRARAEAPVPAGP